MKNDSLQELAVSLALIVLLFLLVNPWKIFMPTEISMMLLAGIAVLFLLFANFMWKETARDERESMHRLLASRASFLAGAAILLAGIIIESIQHRLDPWLVGALGAMVIAKLVARAYSRTNF